MLGLVKGRSNTPAPRRRGAGGSRREASERVLLRSASFEAIGWTLNVSRGGVRIVVEEPVRQGAEYDFILGDGKPRRVRIVWVQKQADGQIVGAKFLDTEGSVPPPAPTKESGD
jgi:hypothetical protein